MRLLATALILFAAAGVARAQTIPDTTGAPANRGDLDSGQAPAFSNSGTVQGAIYDRPYVSRIGRTAVGGYAEANSNFFVADGAGEGLSFEARRFNIFLFSSISDRITLTSELEFEHGVEEIALETALIDFRLAPQATLRAGILLVPIGAFNQSHDSPLWEFIDRPLVSTQIIPTTLSEVGAGVHGVAFFTPRVGVSYEVDVTNGIGNNIVFNELGRTSIAAGKDEERFGEDNNGSPAFSGRVALLVRPFGEVGLSTYGGAYNSFQAEGTEVADRQNLRISAIDLKATVGPVALRGEAAMAWIDVPDGLADQFGDRQWGGFLDIIVPVKTFSLLGYDKATVTAAVRLEYVDFNMGTFSDRGAGPDSPIVGDRIYDEQAAVVPSLTFRPTESTVFKLNYRRDRARDLFGNPATRSAGIQAGFATYF